MDLGGLAAALGDDRGGDPLALPPISGERYWPFHVSRSAFDGSFPFIISWRPYGAASGRSARPTTRRERIASATRRALAQAKFSDDKNNLDRGQG